jgi:phosphoribosylanthranilate isomerase
VAKAIEAVKPDAVDTASGVEIAPGRKDPGKLAAFIQEATTAFAEPRYAAREG